MAKVVIPVSLDTKEVKQNTRTIKGMMKSLSGATEEAGGQFEKAFAKGGAKTAKLVTDLQKANVEVKKQANQLAELKSRLEDLNTGKGEVKSSEITALKKELSDAEKAAEKTAAQMDKLSLEADRLRQTSITIGGVTTTADQGKYEATTAQLDKLGEEYQQLQDKAEAARQKLQEATGETTRREIETTNRKIEETSAKLEKAKATAQSTGEALKNSTKKSIPALDSFSKRVGTLAKRVFVFTVIAKAFNALKNLFMKSAQGSEKFQAAMAQLKQSLWAIYSVIYQYVMPIVMKVMQVINRLAQNAVKVLAKLLGKSTQELLNNGKAMEKQTNGAKKATKQLAAFDEVQTISSGSKEDSGTTFKAEEVSAEVNNVLDAILLVAGGAMFVIGLLLVCTGVGIGIGIGLMIAGIAILAVEIMSIDWDKMPEDIKQTLTYIAAIAGGFMLVLGLILLGSGHIGLAVGCLIAGVALIVAAVALNWDSIKEKLQGTLGTIMAIVGGFLLVLGIILCCVGVIPLGIGLIIAGAGSLAAVIAANWDAIVGFVKDVWKAIKDFWNKYIAKIFTAKFWGDLFTKIGIGVKKGLKAVLNGMIWLINKAIDGLNLLLLPIRGLISGIASVFSWIGGGESVGLDVIKIPHIPQLAKGAVIPANRPFLAQLGDQKNGTNIEAPLETIKQAVMEVLSERGDNSNQTFVIELDGREVGRTFGKAIATEQKRAGKSFVKNKVVFG